MADLLMVIFWLVFPLSLIWAISSTLVSKTSQNKHPPGPARLPVIGNLHLLGDLPHKSLAKLAKTHGPLMSLRLGQVTNVVISSSAAAKEVIQKHDLAFSSRSVPDALRVQNHTQYSIVWLPAVDPKWKIIRRVLNTYMFSANRLDASQQLRSRKVQDLIAYCEKNCQSGEAVDIGRAAFRTSMNLLSNILFSKDLTDPFTDSGKEFKDAVWNVLVEAARPNVVDFFPVLRKLDPQGSRRRMNAHLSKVFEMFRGLIRERLERRRSGGGSRDVLDDLLGLSEEGLEEMDQKLIEHTFLDLFSAGTDTTSSTLEWAMAELLRNPSTLKKAQTELAEAIGGGKKIEESDVAQLPYLQCVVKETLRIHPPVPFLIRRVEQDAKACGFVVPGGSRVLVNTWAIGRDETVWGDDVSEFKPERFLKSGGIDIRGKDFGLISFGAGRRICPGMSLAVRTIPIILGSMLNVFDWKLEGGMAPEKLDMEEKFGITLQRAHPLRAVPVERYMCD